MRTGYTYLKVSSSRQERRCQSARRIWWDNLAIPGQLIETFETKGKTNIIKRDQWLRPPSIMVADGEEYAIPPYSRQQLLNKQG